MKEIRTQRSALSLITKTATVVGLSLVLGGCTGPAWQTVDSTEGRFRVSMPGTAEEGSRQMFDTTAGELSFNWKVSRIGKARDLRPGSYMIAYAELPPGHDSHALVQELQHSMAEEFSGRAEDAREFSQPGELGSECSVESVEDTNVRLRVIVSPQMAYLLVSMEPDYWFLPSYTSSFFDSFEILDTAER